MERNALKYLVDALLWADLCATAVVGLLLGFVIPRGPRPPADRFFLGLHRQQWCDIHLWLSLMLLALLAVHLVLNWRWVVQISRRMFGDRWRRVLWLLAGAWLPLLALSWLLARC